MIAVMVLTMTLHWSGLGLVSVSPPSVLVLNRSCPPQSLGLDSVSPPSVLVLNGSRPPQSLGLDSDLICSGLGLDSAVSLDCNARGPLDGVGIGAGRLLVGPFLGS